MAAGRMRSTRRLRSWIVEQVSSGKYPGLVWDDEAKTMFRIPWKHAGKQDFRKDEDAAIFKAWAEFKGKLTDGGQDNPAAWKTRLRCALNKSPEFKEVMDRAQLDISEPYKVYRLVPISEQAVDEIRLDVRIEESVTTPVGAQDSFDVAVYYLGQEVLKRQIQGTDVRITYLPSSPIPPTPLVLKARFPRIPLPEPPSTLPAGPELQALFTLLPFMEKGVVLTSTQQGVYGKRFCQGRVFWTGPHTTMPDLHKMERNTEPVLLFNKEIFKQRESEMSPPQFGFTLCFGEELSDSEDPSKKLIIVQITLPWEEQQVQNAQSIFESITILQSLASQSPLGEITLNLVTVPSPTNESIGCGTF
ncbi:interferon regulatory factor 9 [Neolamprologus brichardi]|uniref:interferon regulatory factor 9 n=1 Tax=Neolamprologus brichardi TaxID=32507 RepID=UPI0016437263|nr:interferon regulatory factor 9 [Neolamprologus brichardi]